jgi:hypothetical protein
MAGQGSDTRILFPTGFSPVIRTRRIIGVEPGVPGKKPPEILTDSRRFLPLPACSEEGNRDTPSREEGRRG